MIHVADEVSDSGLRVHSLYGATVEELSPRPEFFDDVDVLVVDLQDVGSRYYTYIWTAGLAHRVAAEVGVETCILDRPNPLGGERVEGAPQRDGFGSFVGLYDVSVRHGMTLGEVVTMVNALEGIDRDALHVVPMRGWSRSTRWPDTGLHWVQPSPNMPTFNTAVVYPGGCLLEGTLLSEGRGLTRPFEIFGAPWLDGERLAKDLDIPGAILRPTAFEPTFHKFAHQVCGGIQVHVSETSRFSPYRAYLRIIKAIRDQNPDAFEWRTEEYEYVTDRPAIDLLTGGPEYRTLVDRGGEGLEEYLEQDRAAADDFRALRRDWLMY